MTYDGTGHHRAAAEAERRDRDRRTLGANTTASHRQRWWLRLGLTVAAGLVVVGLVAVVTADDGAISEARPFLRPQVDGDTITATWEGWRCESVDPDRTTVVPTDTAVRATLYVDVPISGCEGIDVERAVTFTLGEPVGDRDLIDGACLLPAFLDHPACNSQNVRLD